jgi:hypothetical protein
MPARYVQSFLEGNILFRNLVYFKKLENDPRVDIFEGVHVDAPDNDITLTNMSTNHAISGRFQFHNTSKKIENIYCFCASMKNDRELRKFGDSCVEIYDVEEFRRRIERSLRKKKALYRLDDPILLANPVTYYEVNKPAPFFIDVKNPCHLPFLKRHTYSQENEFRFVFAVRGGFQLLERIVNQAYLEKEDIFSKKELSRVVGVGRIDDIARIIA